MALLSRYLTKYKESNTQRTWWSPEGKILKLNKPKKSLSACFARHKESSMLS